MMIRYQVRTEAGLVSSYETEAAAIAAAQCVPGSWVWDRKKSWRLWPTVGDGQGDGSRTIASENPTVVGFYAGV